MPNEEEPPQVKKRAIDVTPCYHSIWCSVAGGAPFANPIVLRRWSDDGSKITFMLDSHNFLSAYPDEEIDVIECDKPLYSDPKFLAECMARDAEKMKDRPVPVESELDRLRKRVAELELGIEG